MFRKSINTAKEDRLKKERETKKNGEKKSWRSRKAKNIRKQISQNKKQQDGSQTQFGVTQDVHQRLLLRVVVSEFLEFGLELSGGGLLLPVVLRYLEDGEDKYFVLMRPMRMSMKIKH